MGFSFSDSSPEGGGGGYQTASKQVNKKCFYPQHVAFSQLHESKSVEG